MLCIAETLAGWKITRIRRKSLSSTYGWEMFNFNYVLRHIIRDIRGIMR